jgi:hypothetical protein
LIAKGDAGTQWERRMIPMATVRLGFSFARSTPSP